MRGATAVKRVWDGGGTHHNDVNDLERSSEKVLSSRVFAQGRQGGDVSCWWLGKW